MTDIELLEQSITTLGSINVPIALIDQIGAPIYQVRKNLLSLLKAIQDNISKQKTQDDDIKVTEVEVVKESIE